MTAKVLLEPGPWAFMIRDFSTSAGEQTAVRHQWVGKSREESADSLRQFPELHQRIILAKSQSLTAPRDATKWRIGPSFIKLELISCSLNQS